MLSRAYARHAASLAFTVVALPAASLLGQTTDRALQDELDLQANANFVQGSGARAFGMGGAFLARADDATAASWNPAGLSYLRAPEVSLVHVGADVRSRREPIRDGIERDHRESGYPDFAAFTVPWETKSLLGAVQISYQRVLPFQSERTIDLGPVSGSELPRSEVRTVQTRGGFDIFALGAGVRISRRLRLGFTVNRWLNGYEQTRSRPERGVPSRHETRLDLSAWNVHLGAIYSPAENLNLGLVFKTSVDAKAFLHRVRFDQFDEGENTRFNIYSREDVELELPGALGFGISWRPRNNLTVSADYTRTDWSSGRIRNFFTLARAFPFGHPLDQPQPSPPASGDFCGAYGPNDPPPPPDVPPCPPVIPYPTLGTKQSDTDQLRAGAEYVVIGGRLKWPVRVGLFRDSQFFPSFAGGSPSFNGFTLGTGVILNQVLFDLAYVYESGEYTDSGNVRNEVKFQKFYASVIVRLPRRR